MTILARARFTTRMVHVHVHVTDIYLHVLVLVHVHVSVGDLLYSWQVVHVVNQEAVLFTPD